jgi:hypothetical protein
VSLLYFIWIAAGEQAELGGRTEGLAMENKKKIQLRRTYQSLLFTN